ncbi:CLUMA_CG010904, isoform A [Clunio marinus]|uniref:CLUMA_CG010904, isoform A n=1 Tax=Clunio marinus TaxID=568069 RepID=A0A1J1IBC6_9DIPT|nr:CLUMA_CG010904, isoform A [Clunio marinus]
MNKFVLCIVLLNVAMFGPASTDNFSCTPNETYKNDCNTCICSSDGKTAACTIMACLSPDQDNLISGNSPTTSPSVDDASVSTTNEPDEIIKSSSENAVENFEDNNQVCTPNDIKMQDCNRCKCAANGIGWFCTKRICPKNDRKRAVKSPLTPCKPGDSWTDNCNACTCGENGMAVCKVIACFGFGQNELFLRKKRSDDGKCVPGTTWVDDCNTCFCTETGIGACTLKGCLGKRFNPKPAVISPHRVVTLTEYTEEGFSCEPLTHFKLECNNCRCDSEGKKAAWCTKKRCVTTMRIVYFVATTFVIAVASCAASDETNCTEGESFKKDCNTCVCSASGFHACTLMLCVDEQQETTTQPAEIEHSESTQANNQVCTPNEIKMEDCNRCKCAANGIGWFCTKQACPPLQASPQKQPVNSPGFTCKPNEPFMDDCNSCTCDSTGTLARCTAMACPPNERQKRSEIEAGGSSNSIGASNDCVPGSTWKNSCNFCRCSPNGLALCTRRYCPPEPSSIDSSASQNKFRRQTQNTIESVSGGQCIPGAKWMDQCNRCWCSKNGYAACTRMFCPGSSPVNIPLKPAPGFGNELIKSGDNSNKLIFRRKREASEKALNTNKNRCEPKTSWNDDCNHCFCSDNGIAICTLMVCINTDTTFHEAKDVRIDEQEVRKCEPGKIWKEDCNKCLCSLKGKVQCTTRNCEGERNNKKQTKRQLGEGVRKIPFKSNANKKLQTLETLEDSLSVPYHPPGTAQRTVTTEELLDPNFQCQPSLSFKVECNTCWCASNGKEARFCTRIACKPKTYAPLDKQQ